MNSELPKTPINVLLADDDTDDRFFFTKAIAGISISTQLETVHDGEQLMRYLSDILSSQYLETLPDIIFLDLNMPRKTGFECLTEIKENDLLKDIHVVMFSTSHPANINYEHSLIQTLYDLGANDFFRKPSNFGQTRVIIQQMLEKVQLKALK